MSTILQLVEAIQNLPKPDDRPFLIAISGFGGSGKSTLARQLARQLCDVAIVPLDEFWLPEQDVLSSDWAVFDRQRLAEQVLVPARAGRAIAYQVFDWQQGKLGAWRQLGSSDYLIIEGISALHPNLLPYYDFKIWVDCPQKLAEARGLKRGKVEYNIDETEHWTTVWTPNDHAYFQKYRPDRLADFLYSTSEN